VSVGSELCASTRAVTVVPLEVIRTHKGSDRVGHFGPCWLVAKT
jgi:hypothetical protein